MIIGVLVMLCGLTSSHGRSFTQQSANVHSDPYEDLQRKWPSYSNFPTQNHIVNLGHFNQRFFPLIDGKPIYIPDETEPPSSLRTNKIQAQRYPSTQNQEKSYSGLINSRNPVLSDSGSGTNANLQNAYVNNLKIKQGGRTRTYGNSFSRKSLNESEPIVGDSITKNYDSKTVDESTFYRDKYSVMHPQCKNENTDREGACKKDAILSVSSEKSPEFPNEKVSSYPVKLLHAKKGNKIVEPPTLKHEKKLTNEEDKGIYFPSITDVLQVTNDENEYLKPYLLEKNIKNKFDNEYYKKNAGVREHKATDKSYSEQKQNGYNKVPSTVTEHSATLSEETVTPIPQDSDVETNGNDQLQRSEKDPESNVDIHTSMQSVPEKIAFETVVGAEDNTLNAPENTEIRDLLANNNIHKPLKEVLVDSFNSSLRSLVFNPVAQPLQKFQKCKTPKNESGHCRYVHHCLLPSILSSMEFFMDYVCVIQGSFIGVCCPELPVNNVDVKWKDSNFTRLDEPVKTPKECGISSKTRIIGGLKANPKEYPWMAALLSEVTGTFFCGGAIINDRYILTAAHCTLGVPRSKIIARLGEYSFEDRSNSTHQNYKVAQIKRHGQYSRMTLRNDIALLKLSKPVIFNQFVSTICLPEKGEDFVNETAVLAGWGNLEGGGKTSDVLMEASVRVIANQECNAAHGLTITPGLICTGSKNDKKGACNGDSGGPLMLLNKSDKRWKTIGLVSWGRRGCDPTFPTVYTRVTRYLDWIEKHAQ